MTSNCVPPLGISSGLRDHLQLNHCVPVQWLFALDPMTVNPSPPRQWKDLSTPSTSSEIRLKLDPIDLTGQLLSPFFIREFHYQGCRFHSFAHLMCYHYAITHNLKLFATSIRKWSRHLTDFPTNRFQTPDWQVLCRTVLSEIYSHLCLTDASFKTALIDTGPRPFDLQCLEGGGGFCDTPGARGTLVSDILIEAHVGLVAGRLTSAEWLRPTATRGGLRDAPRRLYICAWSGFHSLLGLQPECRFLPILRSFLIDTTCCS